MNEKGKIKFEVGQTFDGIDSFRKYLRDYCIQVGIALAKVKNEKEKITVEYPSAGYPCKIYASRSNDNNIFILRTYRPTHRRQKLDDNPETKQRWIALLFLE